MLPKDRNAYKGNNSILGVSMRIQYDEEADAVYIELRKGVFSKNKKLDDFTIVDYDKEGNLLGMELLCVSKSLPGDSLKEIKSKHVVVESS